MIGNWGNDEAVGRDFKHCLNRFSQSHDKIGVNGDGLQMSPIHSPRSIDRGH